MVVPTGLVKCPGKIFSLTNQIITNPRSSAFLTFLRQIKV
jgi:hypothetical protein